MTTVQTTTRVPIEEETEETETTVRVGTLTEDRVTNQSGIVAPILERIETAIETAKPGGSVTTWPSLT